MIGITLPCCSHPIYVRIILTTSPSYVTESAHHFILSISYFFFAYPPQVHYLAAKKIDNIQNCIVIKNAIYVVYLLTVHMHTDKLWFMYRKVSDLGDKPHALWHSNHIRCFPAQKTVLYGQILKSSNFNLKFLI